MLITNFSSGELSENLNGRVDLQQYYSGASKIKNFEVIPTGGIVRRAGTERKGKLSGECRLIPFILDADNNFIFEFTPGKIYVWKDGEKVINSTTGVQLVIEAPYTSMAEINEIHFAQDYDTMIFVQRNYRPFIIEYSISNDTFSASNMVFDFSPDVQLDDDYDWIVIAGDALPEKVERADNQLAFTDKDGKTVLCGNTAYCVFNGKLYKWDTTTAAWIIDGTDPDVDEELFMTSGKYPGCIAFFGNRLWLASTINDRQKVWASATPDTKGTRYNSFVTYQKYVTVNKVVKDADVHIFTADALIENIDKEEGTTKLVNVTQDLTKEGVLLNDITDYYITNSEYIPVGTKVLSVTKDTVTINADLSSLLTEDTEAVVFTISLWKDSTTVSADDYEYQVTNNNLTTSDCSFNFELASDQNDAIRFIGANKYLTIGTETSVWHVPAGVTALSISVEMSGRYGSDNLQGHAVGTAMVFFAQGKYGIRETYYDNAQEAFQTNNIALLSDQMLFESPAVDFDFVTNPYNRILVTRADGIVAALLYDKTNGIMAWSRIEHGKGKIISTAVTRGSKQSDVVYFAVKDGSNVYLEKYDENAEVYIDSFQKLTDESQLDDYSDDAVIYDTESGTVTTKSEYTYPEEIGSAVYVGYKFVSLLCSMPVLANDPTGKKRISALLVRFLDSYMPVLTCDNGTEEYFTDVETPYSGIKSIDYSGTSETDTKFTIKTDDVHKVKILAVNASVV